MTGLEDSRLDALQIRQLWILSVKAILTQTGTHTNQLRPIRCRAQNTFLIGNDYTVDVRPCLLHAL